AACLLLDYCHRAPRALHSFPTRRSSDLDPIDDSAAYIVRLPNHSCERSPWGMRATSDGKVHTLADTSPHSSSPHALAGGRSTPRSEEHTSELQSRENLVCRLLLEKKKKN